MMSPFLNISDEVHRGALRLTGYLVRQGFTFDMIHQYSMPNGVPIWWILRWKNHATGEKRPLPMRRTESGFELKRPEISPCGAQLYRLHVLSNYPNEIVYLVEGESCVEALEGLGLIATTWPNGASNVDRADWSPLAGRRVVQWPDNDAPGFAAMERVRHILHDLGARVVTLDVAPMGLPPKGDAVDWLTGIVKTHGARELCAIPDGHTLTWQAICDLPVVQDLKVAA